MYKDKHGEGYNRSCECTKTNIYYIFAMTMGNAIKGGVNLWKQTVLQWAISMGNVISGPLNRQRHTCIALGYGHGDLYHKSCGCTNMHILGRTIGKDM